MPRIGPTEETLTEGRDFIQTGMPFPVEIDPYGALFEAPLEASELKNLKLRFLEPLSQSQFASRIEKVVINASGLEWQVWTCVIHLKDHLAPISLTHFGSLYDGESNSDPDGYKASRKYVLSELDRIAPSVGWTTPPRTTTTPTPTP